MEFEAIGTTWHITPKLSDTLQKKIIRRVESFDQTYSRFRKDSWVIHTLSRKGSYALPEDAYPLLSFYKKLFLTTSGKVTPTIGTLLEEVGYDAQYTLKPEDALNQPVDFLTAVDFNTERIQINQSGLVFDFGAAGKGYLVDILAKIIECEGVESYLINAGGDIYNKGELKTIGLEDPDDSRKVIGIVTLADEALCGSAPNRRAWGEYHHIIDPFLLKPTSHIDAVWVKASSCLEADGLATVLFFTSPRILKREFDFEYVIMSKKITQSKLFNADIFTNDTINR